MSANDRSSGQQQGGMSAGGHDREQEKAVRRDEIGGAGREGFGDDMGTRVGRPDAGTPDERSARLSEGATSRGLEGAILEGGDDARSRSASASASSGAGGGGGRSGTRADGSSMEGGTLDHAQRAQSGMPQEGDTQTGAGSEASRGVEGAQVQRGSDEQSANRSGSEPLEGRTTEHKPSYGGEGGAPRTSSDQREGNDSRR